jgi:hypothetical protein
MAVTEAEIRAWGEAAARLQAVGDAFATAYRTWLETWRTRHIGSYSFQGVDLERGQLLLERYCCSDTDTLELPLAYLWTEDWIALEEARLATFIQEQRVVQRTEAAREQARHEAHDRREWERLRSKFSNEVAP